MSDKTIGVCKCPICQSKKASLRLSAKQLAYIVCNACNMQAFSRSDASDMAMRALQIHDAEPAPEPTPAPAPAVPRPTAAQANAAAAPAPRRPGDEVRVLAIAESRPSWGWFGTRA